MYFTQEATKPGREETKIKNSNQGHRVDRGFALAYTNHYVESLMLAQPKVSSE